AVCAVNLGDIFGTECGNDLWEDTLPAGEAPLRRSVAQHPACDHGGELVLRCLSLALLAESMEIAPEGVKSLAAVLGLHAQQDARIGDEAARLGSVAEESQIVGEDSDDDAGERGEDQGDDRFQYVFHGALPSTTSA